MAYYIVANYTVNDQDMYARYLPGVSAALTQYGAKIIVVDHTPNDLEGESGHTLVILEFASEEAAMTWYNSTEYQAVINLRIDASDGWMHSAYYY
jgi:uncharacterized protein (DUF1330 family)